MRLLKAIALVIGLAAPALAGPYQGITVDATKGTATENLSGYLKVAASSVTATTPTVTIDGAAGSVSASSVTAKYGVIAATGAFSGAVSAGSFVGNVTGNASTASALLSAPSLAPSGFVSRGIDVSGNAQTAAVDSTVVAASTNPIQGGAVSTALALKLSLTGGSMSGAFNPAHKTIAQLQAISPTVGDQYTCSDCSPVLVVTATGTSAGNFNFSGGGSGGLAAISIASGTVSNGQISISNPAQSVQGLYLNSASAQLTVSGSSGVISLLGPSFPPTRTVLTSGSGTYTVPAGVVQIKVRMVGGGGGGSASNANSGSDGGDTLFGAFAAKGGKGGPIGTNLGGVGGSGGAGTATFRIPGGQGHKPGDAGPGNSAPGGGTAIGAGAGSSGSGGTSQPGLDAPANGGGGGSSGAGAGSDGTVQSGGGGGEYAELLINSPTTYAYAVGAGGAKGPAGDNAGGNGAAGIIIIDEFYQGMGYSTTASSEAPSGVPSFTFSGKTSFQSVTNVASTTTITSSAVDVSVTCGWSRTGGSFGNSLFSQISRDNGAETFTLPTIGAGTSGQSTNITGNDSGRHLFTGLSAGTHVFQLQVETSDAGTESWTTAGQCKVLAIEQKNAGGTGDASTNGNNTFSGSNTFTGSVTGITRSSYTTSGFGSFTSGTTYSVCLTTLTIPTSGLNPVVVKFSGAAANSVGSAVGVNFLQDGQFVSPWSSTAGPAYGLTGFSAGVAGLAFDVTIPAPSAGSHSYCLGTLVSGGTGSWSAAVKPQFKVYEEK